MLGDKRTIRTIKVPHLPERATIMADEVQSVRAFGSESQVQAVNTIRDERLAKMKRQIEYTIEAHRLAAIMGSYYDAAGNVSSLFTEFGVSQTTVNMALTTSTTKVRTKVQEVIDAIELSLDGLAFSGINVYFERLLYGTNRRLEHHLVVRLCHTRMPSLNKIEHLHVLVLQPYDTNKRLLCGLLELQYRNRTLFLNYIEHWHLSVRCLCLLELELSV